MTSRTKMSARPIDCWGGTDPGRRGNNEDLVHWDGQRGIFIVIDGMGGQAAGEEAAKLALKMLRERLERQIDSVGERIRQAIVLANNKIYEEAEKHEDWHGMACVLTVAVVEDGAVTIGHVGDTRLYKLTPGAIDKVTPDHSPVGEREDNGDLDERAAMQHPRRNEVYRDVGSRPRDMEDEGFVDILHATLDPASALLLCSDGLSDLVTKDEIRQCLEAAACDYSDARERLYHTVKNLIEAANQAGGKDNISVVVVEGVEYAAAVRQHWQPPQAANFDVPTSAHSRVEPPPLPPPHDFPETRVTNQVAIAQLQLAAADRPYPTAPVATSTAAPLVMPSPAPHVPSMLQTPREGRRLAEPPPPTYQPAADQVVWLPDEPRQTGRQSWKVAVGGALVILVLIGLFFAYEQSITSGQQGDPAQPTTNSLPGSGPRTWTVGIEGEKDFKTIKQALAAAKNGDTIQVSPGLYREALVLSKSVNLRAAAGTIIELPAEAEREGTAVRIEENVAGGRFEGFQIRGSAKQPLKFGLVVQKAEVALANLEIQYAEVGLEISGNAIVKLQDGEIRKCSHAGLLLRGHADAALRGVGFSENKNDYEREASTQLLVDGQTLNRATGKVKQ